MNAYPKLIGFDELTARFSLRPFIYSKYHASLAIGATTTLALTIRENTAFAIARLQGWAYLVNTPGTVGYCTVQITDAGTGRSLFDRALPLEVLTGFYANEASWVAPYVVAGNSTLNIQLTSIDTAQILTVWLAFYGVHLYNKVGQAPIQVSADGVGLIAG